MLCPFAFRQPFRSLCAEIAVRARGVATTEAMADTYEESASNAIAEISRRRGSRRHSRAARVGCLSPNGEAHRLCNSLAGDRQLDESQPKSD